MALSPTSSRSSGGALPSQWTIGSGGQLQVLATDDTAEGIQFTALSAGTQALLDLTGQGGNAEVFVSSDGVIHFLGPTNGANVASLGEGGLVLFTATGTQKLTFNSNTPLYQILGVLDAQGQKTSAITSGALPTVTCASGTGRQVSTTRDVETHTPVTFNPGVATTATCKVELSPDNTTYTELATITKPVGTVFDGEIEDVVVRVPAGWYIRLTVNAQASIGTTTYY